MKELLQTITDKSAAYEAIASTGTVAEVRAAAQAVKAARQALAAHLSEGAQPCPNCDAQPLGMLRTPSKEVPGAWVIEVGCINCPPEPIGDGRVRVMAARGFGAAAAVDAWNKGDYVEKAA